VSPGRTLPDVTGAPRAAGAGSGRLARRLGLHDAVVIGLGSMVGAGVFAAFAPAARAAGTGLVLGLGVAALVAACNATSSARLAARYPESGGAYVYGRERLGPGWGFVAGVGFVAGKTASCAAMALTVGHHAWPDRARPVALAVTVLVTTLNWFGVRKSLLATQVIVAVVLAVLAGFVVTGWAGGEADATRLTPLGNDPVDVLRSAGFLFFAFAGYARIATLGEEVRDPAVTIPRAVPIALGITLAVYTAVAVTVLAVLGPDGAAAESAPLVAAARAGDLEGYATVVRVGGAVAAVGSLLALVLGVSRTAFALARDGHLPRALAAVHPRHRVPHRAEVAVGLVVAAVVATADVRGAIGFSSFTVLAYYAIANAAALTLGRDGGTRLVPIGGLAGCALLAVLLPGRSVATGALVLGLAGGVWFTKRARRRPAGQERAERPDERSSIADGPGQPS
jgi:APA family basic amino acid/polyamine antiporter